MRHLRWSFRLSLRHASRVAVMLSIACAVLVPPSSFAWAGKSLRSSGDTGDAPDSTNHSGVRMLAYPGLSSIANFPTVFESDVNAPPGPLHWNPAGDAWLGERVSVEHDADLAPDEDGVTNLDPPANRPNRDGGDDSIFPANQLGLQLPDCGESTFLYEVSAPAFTLGHPNYVNVWFDFNRDGDWADTFTCQDASGQQVLVREWAVQNQEVSITGGTRVWRTPRFVSDHPLYPQAVWMRISLSARKASSDQADGRGPVEGYQTGETEDYFLRCACPTKAYFDEGKP